MTREGRRKWPRRTTAVWSTGHVDWWRQVVRGALGSRAVSAAKLLASWKKRALTRAACGRTRLRLWMRYSDRLAARSDLARAWSGGWRRAMRRHKHWSPLGRTRAARRRLPSGASSNGTQWKRTRLQGANLEAWPNEARCQRNSRLRRESRLRQPEKWSMPRSAGRQHFWRWRWGRSAWPPLWTSGRIRGRSCRMGGAGRPGSGTLHPSPLAD